MPAATFDAELLRRYDSNGPRYTSYPTARQFQPGFDAEAYQRAVARSNDDLIPRDISLYVHVPFCKSPCFYCGCNRVITKCPSPRIGAYLRLLDREAGMQGRLVDRDRKVLQLHFGGGTPTVLSDQELEDLLVTLRREFGFCEELPPETSIEVDPRSVTPQRMETLADIGFNRISFGIQDFDTNVQEAVNRRQDTGHCLQVLQAAKAAGFRSVAVDLIYGLPRQTLEGFAATLNAVVSAKPDRIAVYGYAHMPARFKAQRQINDADLPGPELRLGLLSLAVDRLTQTGYEYIGLDHFALPTDDLVRARQQGTLQRNFQGYSTHAGLDLVGLGLSAIGHVGRTYTQNAKVMSAYTAALDAGRLPIVSGLTATEDDVIRADVINRLMCYDEVRFRGIETQYHVRFREYFSPELKRLSPFVADGLVKVWLDRIQVLLPGRFLLRNLAMVFDAYLPQVAPTGPIFSKSI